MATSDAADFGRYMATKLETGVKTPTLHCGVVKSRMQMKSYQSIENFKIHDREFHDRYAIARLYKSLFCRIFYDEPVSSSLEYALAVRSIAEIRLAQLVSAGWNASCFLASPSRSHLRSPRLGGDQLGSDDVAAALGGASRDPVPPDETHPGGSTPFSMRSESVGIESSLKRPNAL